LQGIWESGRTAETAVRLSESGKTFTADKPLDPLLSPDRPRPGILKRPCRQLNL